MKERIGKVLIAGLIFVICNALGFTMMHTDLKSTKENMLEPLTFVAEYNDKHEHYEIEIYSGDVDWGQKFSSDQASIRLTVSYCQENIDLGLPLELDFSSRNRAAQSEWCVSPSVATHTFHEMHWEFEDRTGNLIFLFTAGHPFSITRTPTVTEMSIKEYTVSSVIWWVAAIMCNAVLIFILKVWYFDF